MPLLTRERTHKSQMGYQISRGDGAYTVGGSEINFANGQMIFIRFPTLLPPGAVINNATVTFNQAVKNANTTQQSLHQIYAHASGNSPRLVPGSEQWAFRSQTAASRQFTMTWTAGSSPNGELIYWTESITSIIQELVGRPDWEPGGYITLMMYCLDEQGSDMGVRANNDFLPTARVTIDYSSPVVDRKFTINMLENSEFNPSINSTEIDSSRTVARWHQNSFFGTFVDTANNGTLAVDTSFTRLPGIPTLRFTCGTPPSDVEKQTGPYTALNDNVRNPTVFCGWIYIPSSVPTNVEMFVGDVYQGGRQLINERGVWTPFCSTPKTQNVDWGTWWFAASMKRFQAGQQFWISEPAIIRSDFRQMPFNGLTPDKPSVIDFRSGISFEQSSRVWTPRRYFDAGYGLRAYPTWIKRSDDILQLVETVKGGSTMAGMPNIPIQDYDPNKRIAEY